MNWSQPDMSATRTASRFIVIDFSCGFQSNVSGGMRSSICLVAMASCSTCPMNPVLIAMSIPTSDLRQRTVHTLPEPEYRSSEDKPTADLDDEQYGSGPCPASRRP